MRITIEESIKVLQEVPKVMPITKESINVALATMRKYQQIEQIIEVWHQDIYAKDFECIAEVAEVVEDGSN